MTQEEKELLLKDLCARLPYGVMIQSVGEIKMLGMTDIDDIESFMPKPYLRPMSSMTEDESMEYYILYDIALADGTHYIITDWLNVHHFDYRGLIDKGLALEAPEGMYYSKNSTEKSIRTLSNRFLELLPKFQWFIERWFGKKTVDYLISLANDNKDDELSSNLNDIWFELPDDTFNIRENPEGWSEFLSILEN